MFAWKRFWSPPDGAYSLADDGFLYDPDGEYGAQINPHAVPFSDLNAKHCLILLGEPGIGKSITIRQELAAVQTLVGTSDDRLISINLGEYGDEHRLIQDVFQCKETKDWIDGSHVLHLFLDSLDECGLQIPHVAKIVRSELTKLKIHLSRLRVRIACRTADWPTSLDVALKEFWKENHAIVELLPLRRCDIVLAAVESGCDAETFMSEVIRMGAQSLAIKPVTLDFLLASFKSNGGFPSRQAELYSRGCRLLCEETNEDRRDAKQVGRMDVGRRFAVAQRIGAAMVFANKSSVGRVTVEDNQSAASLSIADLVGGMETADGVSFNVGGAEVEEVLGRGLFSGRGEGRIGFAHHTYAEFLAATYLANRVTSSSEKLKLLRNPEDSGKKIVPQLGETAAWLAGMDGDVFDAIMECDPQILVRSDVAKADESDRKLLVERLLELFGADEIAEMSWDERLHYYKLNHAELSEQLEPVIRDPAKGLSVRRFAISVARDCERRDLQSLLADVALNAADNYRVRCSAAYAVVAIGDEATHLRLKGLGLSTSRGDEDCTIKALVLRTLWPKHISATELFATLKVPTDRTYGTYRHFLSYELPDGLTAGNVPHALRWATSLTDTEMREYSIRSLIAKMSELGWCHLDNLDVRDAMVGFAIARIRRHEDIVSIEAAGPEEDAENRRVVVDRIVGYMDDLASHLTGLIYLPPQLLRTSDVPWLLAKFEAERNDSKVEFWIDLIEHLFDARIPGHLDAALPICEKHSELDAVIKPQYAAVALVSEEAARLRKQYADGEAWRRQMEERRNPPLLDPPPEVRIQQHLSECEAGDAEAWFLASRDLQLEANSTHYDHDLEHDLTTLPGWIAADDKTRSRLVAGAILYLDQESAGYEWLGTRSTPHGALVGYSALYLVRKESPEDFESLPADVWARWAPIVVDFHGAHRVEDDQTLHNDIARACAKLAPDAVAESIRRIVSAEFADGQIFIMPDFVERAWNGVIAQTLVAAARDQNAKPDVLAALLKALLKHECTDLKGFADTTLALPIAASGVDRERAIVTASAFMRYADDAGWSVVWPALQSDVAFGRSVIETVAMEDMHNPSIVTWTSESDAAALYVWIAIQYPHASDDIGSSPFVGKRDAVQPYRDTVLRGIQHRGTANAVDALVWIASELPSLTWIKWVIAEARRITLQATWRPISAKDLIDIAQTPNCSLVRSGGELQDVLLDSLASLQVSLQGETPAARDLWDKNNDGTFRPVDENDLSNYLKRHFERDLVHRGIVALREVEIRRGEGHGKGERTDLHVTGLVPGINTGEFDQVRVIIEVKASWHPEVDTAMKSQLVDRYLRENPCQNGIYVVGWYECLQWDKKHSGYKKSRRESAEAVARRLRSQAAQLSNDTCVIKSFVLDAALR